MIGLDFNEGDDKPEEVQFDLTWGKYRKEIMNLSNYFLYPQTDTGASIMMSLFQQDKIQDKAIHPIIGMLIKATEVEQALQMESLYFLEKDPEFQRIIIKALSVKIEDLVKSKPSTDQNPYRYYQDFFNKINASFSNLDKTLETTGKPFPNLIGSLLLSFDGAIKGIKYQETPPLNPRLNQWRDKIREGYIRNNETFTNVLSTSRGVKDKFFSYLPTHFRAKYARVT